MTMIKERWWHRWVVPSPLPHNTSNGCSVLWVVIIVPITVPLRSWSRCLWQFGGFTNKNLRASHHIVVRPTGKVCPKLVIWLVIFFLKKKIFPAELNGLSQLK